MSQRFEAGDVEGAKKAGVIDEATADRLASFLKDSGDPGAAADNESLRFLTNFNDVFLSVGLVLLSAGIAVGSGMLFAGTGNMILVGLPVVIALWIMLEYFAGRRRLLLPSMTLSVMITWIGSALFAIIASGFSDLTDPDFNLISQGMQAVSEVGIWASIGALVSAAVIFLRFRLPFSFFLMAVSAASLVFVSFARLGGDPGTLIGASLMLITGFVTLAIACVFDMRDPDRASLTSDNGFWLNFAAAPQIIIGLGILLDALGMPLRAMPGAVFFIAALIPLALLSLALNRRALIAASLISFWIAVTAIVSETSPGNTLQEVVLALLLTGGGVVLLSSGWKTARRMVLSALPGGASGSRLFPPEPA